MSLLPLRLAWRGLRGGRAGWFTIVACLMLGVGAIAASLSLDYSLRRALSDDSRALLGGDAELRLTYREPSEPEVSYLRDFGDLSQSAEMRVMARTVKDGRQTLAELKTIDEAYPLFGKVDLAPAQPLAQAVAQGDDAWGAAAEQDLLDRLGLAIGDRFTIGEATFILRAVIQREPDRAGANFSLGPRLLVASGALPATGLIQPGSLVHHLVLMKLTKGHSAQEFRQILEAKYDPPPWLFRDASEATPSLKRLLDRTTLFLTLVGLTSLLVGGIGIADGATAFVDQRLPDIAKLKCLGASNSLILWSHSLQFALLALFGMALGLALGATAPWVVTSTLGDRLPVEAHLGVAWLPLAKAAAFGLLASITFATGPLARTAAVSGAQLLRDRVAPLTTRFRFGPALLVAIAAVTLACFTVLISADRKLATSFVIGGAVAFGLFWLGGHLVVALARLASRRKIGRLPLRLALSSLHRPGSLTQGVVLSLGLGLSLLVGLTLVEVTLSREIDQQIPAKAPSFFFVDIQSDQAEKFDQVARAAGAEEISRAVMIRGRITRIKGVSVSQVKVADDAAWAVKGDRGLTVADMAPADADIVAGSWWAKDYDGPPLVSLDANIAKGFGVTLGDTITVDVLGREITAKIASLRRIDWASLGMNFTFVLSPNALAGAPVSEIATVRAPPDKEAAVERAVSDALPTISVVRISDALAQLRRVVDGIGIAIRAAAGVALLAGGLVLAAAISAGQRRRIAEAVLLKVLGAARADLLRAVLWEFVILGGAAGAVAGVVGCLIAWGVLTKVLRMEAVILPLPVVLTLGIGVAAVALAGLAGTWRALAARPAPYLRNE
jgi:putative ABC transport system permease protein